MQTLVYECKTQDCPAKGERFEVRPEIRGNFAYAPIAELVHTPCGQIPALAERT